MLGILASSGASHLGRRFGLSPRTVDTPWGSVTLRVGSIEGQEIVCLARHTEERTVPPHRVNYRANIAALASMGCTAVLATNAVGSLLPEVPPTSLCVPDQILDFTRGRPATFHEDEMVAVDMTQPYCPRLSAALAQAVEAKGYEVHTALTYACMEGPRFETAAEIRMLATLGAHLVGMTAMPEAALAREKRLCYASLCMVTNLAAGIEGHHPTSDEVVSTMGESWETIEEVVAAVVATYTDDPSCPCHRGGR
ncbi:MAG: S-methyl-5'-thioinosine phosphorylase [Armatimonadetes bacterium]|nr:S-methyl-5'-thioinosine phosphorylase [Armatimonadota bacterium]